MGSGNTLELAALLRRSKAFLMGRVVPLLAFSKMSQITSVFKILPTRPAVLLRENLSKLPDLEEEALTVITSDGNQSSGP